MDRDATISAADYKRAVARIIRDLQAQHGLSDLAFAEEIRCSIGTVRNARNEESDLGALYLARIEARFGPGSCDPYHALSGARAVPVEVDASCDPLPSTTAAIHRLAVARSQDSPGGEAITHTELLDMEPVIDAAIRALGALKARCEKVRAA